MSRSINKLNQTIELMKSPSSPKKLFTKCGVNESKITDDISIITLKNVRQVSIKSLEDLQLIMDKAIDTRSQLASAMNLPFDVYSSRAHTIFNLFLWHKTEPLTSSKKYRQLNKYSKFIFVELAGNTNNTNICILFNDVFIL